MNIIRKRSCFGLVALAAITLTGCGGSGSNSPEEGMGVFNLSVSDGGIEDAAKVCIKFDGVQLKKADEDAPIDIIFGENESQVVNLLANQGANSQPIITNEQVPAGNYEWIRLMVDASKGNNAGLGDADPTDPACLADDGSYLLTETGMHYSLFIPSGDQSGLKLIKDINIPVNASGDYTAEWDLGKSFIAPPGLAPDAIMKPVVKLVANNEVGTLVGQVADNLVLADSCDDTFAPKVYVFDDGVTPNPIDYPPEVEDPAMPFVPDPNDPVATGLVEQQMDNDTMPYRYSIGFLLAGDYEVAFTCDGETFVPELGEAATIAIGAVEEINFGDLPTTE
ncbi:MAG: DUF4382 domain-containing protein [Gammaproteobacteria bacterium]|nr:DUF4382 domain-containing protein [Gammaproteobacteria bacterium]